MKQGGGVAEQNAAAFLLSQRDLASKGQEQASKDNNVHENKDRNEQPVAIAQLHLGSFALAGMQAHVCCGQCYNGPVHAANKQRTFFINRFGDSGFPSPRGCGDNLIVQSDTTF